MTYSFHLVNGHELHPVLEPLYRQHYAEMKARLDADGIPIGDYNPQLKAYFEAMDNGSLLTFIVLENETVVGYSNVWLHNDMHNSELMATEDTVYLLPEHRNGVGRKFVKQILEHLQGRGVRRLTISSVTDLRADKLWQRMGFRPAAQIMTYTFEGN
jgi:GNAT superfamily N-acetyltransferase